MFSSRRDRAGGGRPLALTPSSNAPGARGRIVVSLPSYLSAHRPKRQSSCVCAVAHFRKIQKRATERALLPETDPLSSSLRRDLPSTRVRPRPYHGFVHSTVVLRTYTTQLPVSADSVARTRRYALPRIYTLPRPARHTANPSLSARRDPPQYSRQP